MKHARRTTSFIATSVLLFFFLAAFTDKAKAGLDYYDIYLGKQLLMKRYVNQPLSLQALSLNKAAAGEQLIIHYSQCNAPGKLGTKRSLSLKDEKGNTIKQWSYADAQGTNNAMAIPVKELLQWQKKSSGRLSLSYFAEGKSEGETLAYLPSGDGAVSAIYPPKSQPKAVSLFSWLPLGLSFLAAI